jgi:tRNA(Ile)-lysidine synthase
MVLAENASTASPGTVVLRTPRAGDRVRIRHSRGAKPLKEIFERMQVEPEARKTWPVLEWQRQIVWMKGVDLEPEREVPFAVEMVSAA